jgi:hypothetical protein
MEISGVRGQVSGKRDIKAETSMWDYAGVTKNSKSQISNNKQITMTNPPPADQTCFGHLDFGNSNLFRISIFGFRI